MFRIIEKLLIPLVDDEDRIIGYESKEVVHQKGLLHRAFSIFIYRDLGNTRKFLLQQRSAIKYHCANLWSNTCCSHPYWDELSMKDNAKQRLEEEFGFICPLQKIGSFKYHANLSNHLIEHEIDHIFIGDYIERTGEINPNPKEIQKYEWLTKEEIIEELQQYPSKFTPWFENAFSLMVKKICF